MADTGALILVYHAVERGPRPLCEDPGRFGEQLDALADAGVSTLTMTQLRAGLAGGSLPERAVAITFDDGFTSVIEHAVPALLERGMRATVFCVAGHLGGANDWATQPHWAPRRPLAGAAQLAELPVLGVEIGSHGVEHLPLAHASEAELTREIAESREVLEQAVGAAVRCMAYPYGSEPPAGASTLLEATYDAACGMRMGRAQAGHDPYALPRVDAHYVHRPALLRRVAAGSLDTYLGARRCVAELRRRVRPEWPASRARGAGSHPPSHP